MSKAIISMKGVSKIYGTGESNVVAVQAASFKILKGDLALITGPSGSGKSTLLYLMASMIEPDRGVVKVNGKNLAKLSDTKLSNFRKRTIGFVFQDYNLLPALSALDNVVASRMFNDNKKYARAKEILDELGIGKRKTHKPSQLSGGEQQRVAIARALLNDPKIIFADEPTGNLDSEAGRNIIRILKSLDKKGITVVLATHNEDILGGTETVQLRMFDGRVKCKRRQGPEEEG